MVWINPFIWDHFVIFHRFMKRKVFKNLKAVELLSKVFSFCAEPLSLKNMKLSFLALGCHILIIGQSFSHILGVALCGSTFCFLIMFSLMKYIVTVAHFYFLLKLHFSIKETLKQAPYWV